MITVASYPGSRGWCQAMAGDPSVQCAIGTFRDLYTSRHSKDGPGLSHDLWQEVGLYKTDSLEKKDIMYS